LCALTPSRVRAAAAALEFCAGSFTNGVVCTIVCNWVFQARVMIVTTPQGLQVEA